jgi:hypothetical protein
LGPFGLYVIEVYFYVIVSVLSLVFGGQAEDLA